MGPCPEARAKDNSEKNTIARHVNRRLSSTLLFLCSAPRCRLRRGFVLICVSCGKTWAWDVIARKSWQAPVDVLAGLVSNHTMHMACSAVPLAAARQRHRPARGSPVYPGTVTAAACPSHFNGLQIVACGGLQYNKMLMHIWPVPVVLQES